VKTGPGCYPFSQKTMQLFVVVQENEIIVTSETGFRAAYCKRPNHPQLKVRRRAETEPMKSLLELGR
jgi:hypothetical protein